MYKTTSKGVTKYDVVENSDNDLKGNSTYISIILYENHKPVIWFFRLFSHSEALIISIKKKTPKTKNKRKIQFE